MKWVILCKLFSIQQGRALAALPCCFPLEKDPCAESLEMSSSKTHSIGWAYMAFRSCFIQNRLIALCQALHSVPRRQFPQNDRICGTYPHSVSLSNSGFSTCGCPRSSILAFFYRGQSVPLKLPRPSGQELQ